MANICVKLVVLARNAGLKKDQTKRSKEIENAFLDRNFQWKFFGEGVSFDASEFSE